MTKERKYTLDQMLGPRPAAWKVVMATVGLLAVAVATLMPILNVLITYGAAGTWWKYLFAAGALLFLAGKLLSPYRGEHPRIRRLYRIESWSAIFFCVAAFFLFYNALYSTLVLSGELHTYLADLNEQATERCSLIIEQMAEAEGVDEAMKAENQMLWVQSMNSIRSRAEEIIMHELIYD